MLIPIGSWCRAAYQTNEFVKARGAKPSSFPYDWTITPFAALKITLDINFNPAEILRVGNLSISKFGSVTDESTQLIHHHDFTPHQMEKLKKISTPDDKGIPCALYDSDLIDKAVNRFSHTYQHLEALKDCDQKLSFVRWNRYGHPDPQIPHVFEGESITSLSELIGNFLSHGNFSLLTVTTKYISGELPRDPIAKYDQSNHGISSTILERKGFNGDGTNNFRGDTVAWNKLLSRFVEN